MQTVRKVYSKMKKDLQSDHPFCRQELLSDGTNVFTRFMGPGNQEQIVEVLSKQGVFSKIILPFLQTIDYDRVKLIARRWRIADGIVVDPEICFGAPTVERSRVPSSVLANSYMSNDQDENIVAGWFGIQPSEVLVAVRFETGLAA